MPINKEKLLVPNHTGENYKMEITCTQGHKVCECPDGDGWILHAESFTNYAEGQYHVTRTDKVPHISQIGIIDKNVHPAGRCMCGAVWSCYFKEELNPCNTFCIHTKKGWKPDNNEMKQTSNPPRQVGLFY